MCFGVFLKITLTSCSSKSFFVLSPTTSLFFKTLFTFGLSVVLYCFPTNILETPFILYASSADLINTLYVPFFYFFVFILATPL